MGFDSLYSVSPASILRSAQNAVWAAVGKTAEAPKVSSPQITSLKGDALGNAMANVAGNSFIKLAGVYGAVAVMMGAYGSHVFLKRKDVPDELKEVYRTGNQYHFLHTLVLLAMPQMKHPLLVGSLISTGMTIFCGTCYLYSMTGDKGIGRAAPYGGTLLILGWLSMLL